MIDPIRESWRNQSDERMLELNPDLAHIIGKSMEELKLMFPLATACTHIDCDFDLIDHGICMEFEHDEEIMKKRGMIRIMYTDLDFDDNNNMTSRKIFEWWNGDEWVTLTQ